MVSVRFDIKRLRTIISNVWLLKYSTGENYLVDTGHTAELPAILLSLKASGIRGEGDLRGILLTHRHSDHAANAGYFAQKFKVPVYCHRNDLPFLRGEKKPPRIPYGIGRFYDDILIAFENKRPAVCQEARPFEDFDNPDFIIYDAFGHTEGSVMIYHRPSKILFSGDVLFTGIPAIGRKERLFAAVEQYSNDVKMCHRYLLEFLSHPPVIARICSGHGPLVEKDVMIKLRKFKESLKDRVLP
jgi:glyoxylase-like metal-dependent hydrolase (beta-lactamase superfamily II)